MTVGEYTLWKVGSRLRNKISHGKKVKQRVKTINYELNRLATVRSGPDHTVRHPQTAVQSGLWNSETGLYGPV